jgi:succinate dehydrogenase / fumarate reductase membrane anchor subunit
MGRITSLEEQGKAKGTALGRVRGLGSAHHGAGHWVAMQYSSAASLVTGLYLAFSLLLLSDLSYASVRAWASGTDTALALGLLIVSVFWHTRLGLQVLIEDYVDRPGSRFATLMLMNFALFAGAAFALLTVLRLALGGAA